MMNIEKMIEMGFKRWQKNGMDRLYVNASVLGLDADANTFQGKKISGSVARSMMNAKTYIDLVKSEIRSDSVMLAAAVAELLGIDYRYGENTIALPDEAGQEAQFDLNINKEDGKMKTMNYQGHEIELTAVSFRFADEANLQEGILVHDTTDEFSDGDAIFGNGWTLDAIQDESDLESLLTSGDGSTYITRNADGTYNMDA